MSEEMEDRYRALDCEMVGVGYDGLFSALARVTIVDWHGNTVYDTLVQPTDPVTDYRTHISGITAASLIDALDWETCRAQVQQLLHDKILVGHALKNDLHALWIYHPWQQTRDTAKYAPFMKTRFDDGILWPRKLRDLVQEKLHRRIQTPDKAHSPIEDAFAAMQLYKSVRTKWEKVMEYKIQKTAMILEQQYLEQEMQEQGVQDSIHHFQAPPKITYLQVALSFKAVVSAAS